MISPATPYIIVSIAATASVLISALYLWSYRPRLLGAGAIAVMFLASAEWMLASTAGLASNSLEARVFWDNVQYLGVAILPTAWLVFALQYTGRAKRLSPRTLSLLSVVPLVTVLLVFTNSAHGLIWSRAVLDTRRPFVVLDKTYGVGFWVFILYSYSLVLVAAVLLAQMLARSPRLYRWPAVAILLAMPIPWLMSALEVLDLNPLPTPEPTVLGLAIVGPILAWTLPRWWLGNVGPVARQVVIERMGDAVVVLDEEDRIMDLNPFAQRLFDCTLAEVIGQDVARVWPAWPEQLPDVADATPVEREVVLATGDLERAYDVRISDLVDPRGRVSNRVGVLRDITERKRAEQDARRRSDELATLNAIAMNVTSTLELEEILRTIQQSVLKLLGAKYAPLFALFNEEDQTLDLVLTGIQQPALRAVENLLGWRLDQLTLPVAALNQDMWDALLARKPYLTTEGANVVESSMYRTLIQAVQAAMEANCMVHLPLWAKGKLVGSMLVFLQRERVSDEEIEVLSAVASQAAIAIENATLYDESQRRFRQSELLRTASEAVASTLDLPEVLRRIAQQITLSIDATSAYICDLEQEADKSTVLAEYYGPEACPEERVSDLGHTYDESDAEFLAVLRANQCWNDHVDDPDLPEGDRTIMLQYGAQSVLYVPLWIRERLIGYAEVYESRRRREFTVEEITVCQGIAQSAAIAIENARLFEELRTSLRERDQAQAQLIQSAKLAAVGQMIGGVAHELNNPLTTVMGYTQLLQMSDVDESVKEDLQRIYNDALRAQGIVQNLLTFARQQKPQRTPVDINELIERTLALVRYQLEVCDIQIVTTLEQDLPWTVADASQLQQVLLNAINNARHAMVDAEGGGVLTITTELLGEATIRITVADTGPGIPPDVLDKVFDPFFTTREVGTGTGLGLSAAHGIVQEHDGRIWVESEPGHGATLLVELPVKSSAADVVVVSDEHEHEWIPPQGQKILVIDDEHAIVDCIVRALQDSGYQADGVLTAELALKKLREDSYDLIISDIKMPGMDGPACREQVEAMDPLLAERMIFITGDAVSPKTQTFLTKWSGRCLDKPFRVEHLRAVVAEALASDTNAHRPHSQT